MCGIYGWWLPEGSLKKHELNVVSAILASENDNRGGDSWGYAYLESHSIQVKHGLGLITKGTRANRVADHLKLMAHTRKASHGAVTVENAHPYHIGKIVGAHNGVVANHQDLNRKYKRTCEVDSQHIFHHLDEGKDLDEIFAWGAVEYIQTDKPGAVYLGRFDQGSLAIRGIGKGPDEKLGVVWSSTSEALEKALGAAGVKSFRYELKPKVLYSISRGQLWEEGPLPIAGRPAPTYDHMPPVLDHPLKNDKQWSLFKKQLKKVQQCELCGEEHHKADLHKIEDMLICDLCKSTMQ